MCSLLFFVSIISVMTAVADIRAQGQHTAQVPEDIPVGFHPEGLRPGLETESICSCYCDCSGAFAF